jgi:hypothetical protein
MPGWWVPGGNPAGTYERNSRRVEAREAKLEKLAAKREARQQRKIARRALADTTTEQRAMETERGKGISYS